MRINKITAKNNSSLILCFGGWSASPGLFSYLKTADTSDIWICYDYRDLEFTEDLSAYKHVHLIAWSLGVWVANLLFAGKQEFDTATAINGTPFPIDEEYGISPHIFKGTLAHITEEGMRRFNRRVCVDRDTLAAYSEIPLRPLEELREELQFLHDQIVSEQEITEQTSLPNLWTLAIIGSGDKIFPVDNLRRYWEDRTDIRIINAPHFPFYHYQSWSELWS